MASRTNENTGNHINHYSKECVKDVLSLFLDSDSNIFEEVSFEEQKKVFTDEGFNLLTTETEKFEIILYLTLSKKFDLLTYLKELDWDFDFYYKDFTYPNVAVFFSDSLAELKFYFEKLELDFDYSIKDFIYNNEFGRFELDYNDLLYISCINNLSKPDGMDMFKYIFEKVIENNPKSAINSNILFNIINCSNIEFIEEVIDRFNLDFYKINSITRISPLMMAFERCNLETIKYFDEKYDFNLLEKIKRDTYIQEFILTMLFNYINIGKITNYIFDESERIRVLEYIITSFNKEIIDDYVQGLIENLSGQIDCSALITVMKKRKLILKHKIEPICHCSKKHIDKSKIDYFYINKKEKYIFNAEYFIKPDDTLNDDIIKIYINDCICMDSEIKKYFIFNCGHMICSDCIINLMNSTKNCSFCRKDIEVIGYVEF